MLPRWIHAVPPSSTTGVRRRRSRCSPVPRRPSAGIASAASRTGALSRGAPARPRLTLPSPPSVDWTSGRPGNLRPQSLRQSTLVPVRTAAGSLPKRNYRPLSSPRMTTGRTKGTVLPEFQRPFRHIWEIATRLLDSTNEEVPAVPLEAPPDASLIELRDDSREFGLAPEPVGIDQGC